MNRARRPRPVDAAVFLRQAVRVRRQAVVLRCLDNGSCRESVNGLDEQMPAEARHCVVDGWNESEGHDADAPVHVSATSHTPADARHWVPADWKPSDGHAMDVPSQTSATSQAPTVARQTLPAFARPSFGQIGRAHV